MTNGERLISLETKVELLHEDVRNNASITMDVNAKLDKALEKKAGKGEVRTLFGIIVSTLGIIFASIKGLF